MLANDAFQRNWYGKSTGYFSIGYISSRNILELVEDAERNDGSVNRPHLMSAKLKNILVNFDELHVYRPKQYDSAATNDNNLSTDGEI